MCHVPCHFILFSYSFPIHFRSSFHSFLFSVHSLVLDSYALVPIPSGLLFYASVLVHAPSPSSRPFHISFVRDRYVVASLFQICTTSCFTLPCLFGCPFQFSIRQLYSLLVPLVWDQLEHALFFQSLVPPFPFCLEFAPSSSLLLPGCCSSL